MHFDPFLKMEKCTKMGVVKLRGPLTFDRSWVIGGISVVHKVQALSYRFCGRLHDSETIWPLETVLNFGTCIFY